MIDTDMRYYEQKPASGKAPESLVILLHGLGADGRDLMGLAPFFAERLPDTAFVAPDAPFPCDMAPMGRQWFSLQEWTPETILAGAKAVVPVLDAFIEAQIARFDVAPEKLVLAGFSQGAAMSLYCGLRFRAPPAGILGYSGWLIGEEDFGGEGMQTVPVHLIHGEADPVVPVFAWRHASETLRKAGYPVGGEVRPGLAHGIDDAGIASGAGFLERVLKV